jgi:hypothetical protein
VRLDAEQKKFIRTNYGKLSVRKMAKQLQVEPMAVAPLSLHNRFVGGEFVLHSKGVTDFLLGDTWENNIEISERTLKTLKLYFSAHESDWELSGGPDGELGTHSTAMGVGFGVILPLGFLGLLVSIRGFRKRGLLVWFVLLHLGVFCLSQVMHASGSCWRQC